jgi:hypothetical protein
MKVDKHMSSEVYRRINVCGLEWPLVQNGTGSSNVNKRRQRVTSLHKTDSSSPKKKKKRKGADSRTWHHFLEGKAPPGHTCPPKLAEATALLPSSSLLVSYALILLCYSLCIQIATSDKTNHRSVLGSMENQDPNK